MYMSIKAAIYQPLKPSITQQLSYDSSIPRNRSYLCNLIAYISRKQMVCNIYFQMNKNGPPKIWKEVHKSRKNSVDSLNDSVASNHSSLSSGYNRFHFNRPDEPNGKRSAIFQFTARNQQQPYDISILTQRSHKKSVSYMPNRDTPVRDNAQQATPNNDQPLSQTQRMQQSALQLLAKQLKFLTNSLRNTIEYFSKQIRQLKIDWDLSMKQLLQKQINIQTTSLISLRNRLDEKQQEIQAIGKDQITVYRNSFNNRVTHYVTPQESQPNKTTDEGALSRLAISKVDQIKTNEIGQLQLSRNNTIKSLLRYDSNATANNGQRENKELRTLKEAIKRMREVLDPAQ